MSLGLKELKIGPWFIRASEIRRVARKWNWGPAKSHIGLITGKKTGQLLFKIICGRTYRQFVNKFVPLYMSLPANFVNIISRGW